MRLFFALDLPEGARAEVAGWRDSVVDGHEELRPVASDALHVTLIFLGRRHAELVPELWAVAREALAAHEAARLAVAGLVAVPRRRPRLLALDLEDPRGRAGAVHGALAEALTQAGLHEPEARAFWPHVTLARVRARARLQAVEAPATLPAAFEASVVSLYRSDLHPAGTRYVALERLELARRDG